jgi:hypothetical protein
MGGLTLLEPACTTTNMRGLSLLEPRRPTTTTIPHHGSSPPHSSNGIVANGELGGGERCTGMLGREGGEGGGGRGGEGGWGRFDLKRRAGGVAGRAESGGGGGKGGPRGGSNGIQFSPSKGMMNASASFVSKFV